MESQKKLVLVFLLHLANFSSEIYVPDQDQYQKPVYTSGIKTSNGRPTQVQYHHNYSQVNRQYPDGYSSTHQNHYQEPVHRVYPAYNTQTYGNRPTYVLNGTKIRNNENPLRKIVNYNKEKRSPKVEAYRICPYNATGQFPYEFSCNQYLNCWRGRGYPQNCAPGTLFNPKSLECDFPEKVQCISGPRMSVLDEKSSKLVKQIGCPKEFSGLIPNYTDCSKFINCVSGIENFMDCPAGTLFDVDKNICDFAHKARCFNGENEKLKEQNIDGKLDFGTTCHGYQCSKKNTLNYKSNEVRCPQGVEGLHKHPTDCSKFLNCNQGQTFIQDCAPGTLFNPTIKICDFPYNVVCEKNENSPNWGYKTNTEVPVYIPSNTNRIDDSTNTWRGHDDDYDNYKTTTMTHNRDYGGYSSSTPRYHYNNLDGTDNGYNTNVLRPDQYRNRSTSQYYDHNTGSLYYKPTQQGNYGYHQSSGNGYYQQTGSDYGHQQNYGYGERPAYSTHRTTIVLPPYDQSGDHPTYRQNEYDSYGTSWNQRPSTSWNQNQYDDGTYNQQWKQSQLVPSSTNRNVYNQDHQYHQQGSHYDQHHYPIYYNNRNSNRGTLPSNNGQNTMGVNQYGNYNERYDPYQNRGSLPYYNNTRRTSGQTNWDQNRYHQDPNDTYNQRYDPYQNRGSVPYYNNTRGTYGQTNWDPNRYHQDPNDTYNQRYDPYQNRGSIPYYNSTRGSYGQTYYDSNRYHQNPNYQEPSHRPSATVYQRGESGYNRFDQYPSTNQQANWNQPSQPNHDHVVNINQRPMTQKPIYRSSYEPFYGTTTKSSINPSRSMDYEDTHGTHQPVIRSTTSRNVGIWPPPFPSTDVNADYVFEYDDDAVTLEAENAITNEREGECAKSEFKCTIDKCISKTLVCNGQKDCPNGIDELKCLDYVAKFSVTKEHKLAILEKERWDNVSIATCALLCIETRKFQCKSFNYRKVDKTCFLSDANEGLTGALIAYYPFDYYEVLSEKIDCSQMYTCTNKKCIERSRICDGKDDCGDRGDEKRCSREAFGYSIRLTGSNQLNEGNIEVTAFGKTGYVCDDNFGMRDADVVCRELGFDLGAVEVKKNSFFQKNSTRKDPFFMMDDVTCVGNETKLMDCDFSGWGVHNCQREEIAGVVCKTPQDKCPEDYWQCETRQECLPLAFVCDGLLDCTDGSDEKPVLCEAPTQIRLVNGTNRQEGRVEIKHHGIWGTICDDDFNEDAAKVICRYLGYKGSATVRKEAYFGSGKGPIWLDQVFCSGNETSIESCTHWNWGEHNCEHSEDVGVVCSNIYEHERHSMMVAIPQVPQSYPRRCGYRKDNIFTGQDDVHFRVVKGSVARRGEYPWQAALRVKGKTAKTTTHWCGAVIISEKFVLSAAHCLMGYPKGAYAVVAGDYDVDEAEGTEQEAYIDDYYIHEKFREGHKMNNDIALIKLKGRGFRFTDDVQPICLPENGTLYDDRNCTISGFGTMQSGKSAFSHQLRAGWVPIQKREICTMPHVYGEAITEGMICAGSLDEGVDACDGDSGGPLACLHEGVFTLFGITSWGQHCGYANKPGVYVNVTHYRKWIDDNFRKYSIGSSD